VLVSRQGGTWSSGTAYEAYVGRWSRAVAARFVPSLAVPARGAWVDVGSGTGVLTAAVLEHADPSSVVGVDASAAFLQVARDRVVDSRVRFEVGDAADLPLPSGTADAVVSGLVLNFLPDRVAALADWRRVLRPGGVLGVYVWDYAGEMQLMRRLWDAAVELDPAAAALDEGRRSAFCSPGPLRELAGAAGFADAHVEAIDVPTVFRDFGDYWSPFLGGTGPAPAYVTGLSPVARERLRDLLHARLPRGEGGTIPLMARAWGLRARRPE
jgi:SAM-dependent methyltransferase